MDREATLAAGNVDSVEVPIHICGLRQKRQQNTSIALIGLIRGKVASCEIDAMLGGASSCTQLQQIQSSSGREPEILAGVLVA
jgi:hypothetical protein